MSDESPSTPKARVEPRLVVAAFVLIAVLLAAIVGDPTTSSTVVRVDRASVLAPAVVVTGTDIRSTAWYCPIASTSEHIVDDAVVVANLTERHATVELSAIAASKIVGRRTVELPGNGTLSIKVSDLAGGRDVGVVVESFGSAIVVEHVGGDGRSSAATPCATEPSGTWYFAAGSTRLGTRERVAVLNPFGQSAVLDIAVVTSTGSFRPSQLQGIGVGARSRLVLDVNGAADLRPIVGLEVTTRGGTRVVAELALGSASPTAGVPMSLALGAPALASDLHLVDIDGGAGRQHSVVVFNPGPSDVVATVQVLATGTVQVVQRSVTAPAGGIAVFDPATVVGLAQDATVVVRTRGSGVAVGDLITSGAGRRGGGGVAVATAAPVAARRWVFATDQVPGGTKAQLAVENPGGSDAVRAETSLDSLPPLDEPPFEEEPLLDGAPTAASFDALVNRALSHQHPCAQSPSP